MKNFLSRLQWLLPVAVVIGVALYQSRPPQLSASVAPANLLLNSIDRSCERDDECMTEREDPCSLKYCECPTQAVSKKWVPHCSLERRLTHYQLPGNRCPRCETTPEVHCVDRVCTIDKKTSAAR